MQRSWSCLIEKELMVKRTATSYRSSTRNLAKENSSCRNGNAGEDEEPSYEDLERLLRLLLLPEWRLLKLPRRYPAKRIRMLEYITVARGQPGCYCGWRHEFGGTILAVLGLPVPLRNSIYDANVVLQHTHVSFE